MASELVQAVERLEANWAKDGWPEYLPPAHQLALTSYLTGVREHTAATLAAEIISIRRSARKYGRSGEPGHDTSKLLTEPLYRVAAQLQLADQVERQVKAALADWAVA